MASQPPARRVWLAAAALLAVLILSAATARPAAAQPAGQHGRPVLPDEELLGTEHFLIHYTRTGRMAVEPTDLDGSAAPDYVERLAATLEHVWQVQIDELGWPAPPGDGFLGGDARLDVYLEDILTGGYAGYVDTEGGFLGDNPGTPEQERRAAFAYMVLDNDYREAESTYGETAMGLMQATVAHEFNHAIQAGIDDRDLHAWLYEAAATWMEDQVYDDIDDGIYYLNSLYKNPDICLVAEVARGDDLHWYSSWLLLQMMSERYGPEVVRSIWENLRQYNGFGAVDAALAEHGSSLVLESRDFAVANLLRAYDEGHLYPTVRVEGEAAPGTFEPPDGVQSLGADYVRLAGSGLLTVTLASLDASLSLRAVGVRGGEADVYDAIGGSLTLDSSSYSEVYLVVHNDDLVAHENECRFAGYTLEVVAASGQAAAGALAWPADRFVSPYDGPIVSGQDAGTAQYRPPDAPFTNGPASYSTTPEGLDVSFAPIIPVALPEGYVFDYGYIMTEQDFGESAPYYVPGGGETANFDYLDEAGNWLSVAESRSPYRALGEWMDAIEYDDSPGTIHQIDGVEVLVEDLSSSAEVWISATLILDGLFVVVDGDSAEADVLELVNSLVDAASPEGAPAAGSLTAVPQPGNSVTPARVNAPGAGAADQGPAESSRPSFDLNMGLAAVGVLGLCCLALGVPAAVLGVFLARRRG